MRILYHHRTMGRGAEGAHVVNIARAFEDLGHRVFIISPPGVDPLAEVGAKPLDKSVEKVTGINLLWKIISQNAPQFVFEFLEIFYNFSSIFKLRRTVKKYRIDFIYERNAFFLVAGAIVSKWCKIPLIVEANEVVGVERARPLKMKSLASFFEKFCFQQSKAVYTVSSYLGNLIRERNGGKVDVCITPNAITPDKFSAKTRRIEIRKKYNIEEKIVIGFAGWFDWWDRLDLLIDAQKKIIETGKKDVTTMIIGDGPVVPELKEQIIKFGLSDEVILTGAVHKNEVIDYIDSLDIGILPHSNEFGSPMILFEMMALGKAIAAPSLLPITDVITDGVNGLLFNPLDEDDFCDTIVSLCNNKKMIEKIGARAKKDAFNKHTWHHNAKLILSSIENYG